jgi:hypothetical protein
VLWAIGFAGWKQCNDLPRLFFDFLHCRSVEEDVASAKQQLNDELRALRTAISRAEVDAEEAFAAVIDAAKVRRDALVARIKEVGAEKLASLESELAAAQQHVR